MGAGRGRGRMPLRLLRHKSPPLRRGGKIANGDQGGEDFQAPPVTYGDSPLLVEGAFGRAEQSPAPTFENVVGAKSQKRADEGIGPYKYP